MAGFLTKPNKRYDVRSISMPTRSHPSTLRVEEELNKLKSWEASSSSKAETICTRLSGLGVLYRCIEDLLKLPLTQQLLAQNQHEKWVNEFLDGLVRYLDICSKARDAVLLMKENVGELQSALRRRKGGELSIESTVNAYICSRKNMKKEITKSLAALKQMDNKIGASPPLNLDHHLSAVTRVLREASLITISIFQSLLLLLSVPVLNPKPTKWSLVAKLVHKGLLACESRQEDMNEVGSVDFALSSLLMQNSGKFFEAEKIQSAHERLEALNCSIDSLENGLECLFRHLIHTRVSLLNILSH
ncbi:hypothetical protein L1049_001774 [Liquidambar formosana]|uniref:Uncharacterized protein n=1 Tax=Liquidambar formosana TaxID=63359 RepID=A0AAP0R1P3_LIQFO